MKTADIQKLVHEVLNSLPTPYTEDVIDEVMFAIENNPRWLSQYNAACAKLGKNEVNKWCGYWIANYLERTGERTVPSKKNTLTKVYSKLDTSTPPSAIKSQKNDARQLMSDYYRAHKSELPADIVKCRPEIIKLIMEGIPVKSAFDQVIKIGD